MKFLKSKPFLFGLFIIGVGTAVYLLLLPKPGYIPKGVPENCITISRDEITNSWLAPGWEIPGNADYIPSIIFEAIAGDPIKVYAYPVDKNCVELTGKKIVMQITNPTGSKCSFPAGLKPGKTRYDFVPADVDAFGDLIYFNFLRLIPQADPTDPTKLGFKVEFVKFRSGVEVPVGRGDTKPCPPYCPTQ